MRSPRTVLELSAVLAAILVAGWVNLPMPLHGDAALYQVGAMALDEGGRLYRDVWDLKQPGIYLFHWMAGGTLGFSETGLHAFELGYMLLFSALLYFVARRYLEYKWLAPALPILTVGGYYAHTTEWHLTQPAMLLSVPMFVVLTLLSAPASWWRSFAAGAAGAAALLFKFAVAPVVALLFLASWIIDRREKGQSRPQLWNQRVLPALIGGLLVIGAMATWLDQHEALEPFLWIFHTWAPLALQVRGSHPIDRILYSAAWFCLTFSPQILLSFFAFSGWRGVFTERFFVLAMVWLAAGTCSVLTEPFAGWQFDFLFLLTPLGILAVRGLQGLIASVAAEIPARQQAKAVALVLGLAAIPTGVAWVRKAHDMATYHHLASAADHAFQRAVSPRYDRIWRETAFLRDPNSPPGPIYVFGDPIIHTLSRRSSASSIHGWAWELQPAIVWQRLESELLNRPPAFIFAEPGYDTMLTQQSPALRAMLENRYQVRSVDDAGIWYERKDAGDGA